MKLITLRLLAKEEKIVNWNDQIIRLQPGSERTFAPELAAYVVQELGPLVEDVSQKDLAGIYEDAAKPRTLWVANMTGDPDAAEYITRMRINNVTRAREPVPFPNTLRNPMHIKRRHQGGEIPYTDRWGQPTSYYAPSTIIDLPPYQRRELPYHIGKWFITRENMKPEHERGRAVVSRAPSTFEPDMGWDLDDMRLYLHLCDSRAELGPDEAEVRRAAPAMQQEVSLHDAKRLVMKRLHFRVANPKVMLPKRGPFETARKEFAAQIMEQAAEKKTATKGKKAATA